MNWIVPSVKAARRVKIFLKGALLELALQSQDSSQNGTLQGRKKSISFAHQNKRKKGNVRYEADERDC